jgi:hypothetical protein
MYTTKVKFRKKYADSHEALLFKYFNKMLLKEKILFIPGSIALKGVLIEIRKKFLSCSNHKYSGSTADAVV